jgi:hypothetical protein
MMAKFLTFLVVFLSISRFLVAADDDIASRIDHLAITTGLNITGLAKTETLLLCMRAENCVVNRLGGSEWRTQFAPGSNPKNRARMAKRWSAAAKTTVRVGTTQLQYGTVRPYDAFEAATQPCTDAGCDSTTPGKLSTKYITGGAIQDDTVEIFVDGDYPATQLRDAMIAVAANAANHNAKSQSEHTLICPRCVVTTLNQNYGVNYIGVDMWESTDNTDWLMARMHMTIKVVTQSGKLNLQCSALIYNLYNIIKTLAGPWWFLLGDLSFLC